MQVLLVADFVHSETQVAKFRCETLRTARGRPQFLWLAILNFIFSGCSAVGSARGLGA